MATSFEELMLEVEDEARAQGEEATRELDAFRRYLRLEAAAIEHKPAAHQLDPPAER